MLSISTATKPLAVAAVGGLLLALTGCSPSTESAVSPAPVSMSPAGPSPADTSSPSSSTPARAAGNETLQAAGKLALAEVPDGIVVSVESERNGWEVHLVLADGGEQQVRTDLAGTAVVSGPADDRPDADDRAENQQFAEAEVDYRRAVEVVEGEVDGGQVSDLSLDQENGRTVWEADVSAAGQRRTLRIDADNGRVASNQIDN
jgi:hypothetical protein